MGVDGMGMNCITIREDLIGNGPGNGTHIIMYSVYIAAFSHSRVVITKSIFTILVAVFVLAAMGQIKLFSI